MTDTTAAPESTVEQLDTAPETGSTDDFPVGMVANQRRTRL